MKIISHRGNLNGPKKDTENTVFQIESAIELGFDVEMDIWYVDGKLFLGHDTPTYLVSKEFLSDISTASWIHCKNLDAINYFASLETNKFNFFWHESDRFTLTSKNYIWTLPGEETSSKSIAVLPEWSGSLYMKGCSVFGICTDFPLLARNLNVKEI